MGKVVVLPIILALALVMSMLFFLPITLEFFYCRQGKADHFVCIIHLPFKKSIYKIQPQNILKNNLLLHKIKKNPHRLLSISRILLKISKTPSLISAFNKINQISHWLLKKTHCKKLEWSTTFGLADAYWTAILAGLIWNFKNFFYFNFSRAVQVEFGYPKFKVQPIFDGAYLSLQFKCIFVVRLGHIIVTGIKLLYILAIHGLKRGYQVERASNRGFDENSNGKS